MSKALATWETEARKNNAGYSVGGNDVLEISVLSLEGPGQTTRLKRTVSYEGKVDLPLLGSVQTGGLSTSDLANRIKIGYKGKYIKNPDVTITVQEYRSKPVVVTGAVSKPGVYYLRSNRSTVLEVLAAADSLKPEAGDTILIIRDGKRTGDVGDNKVAESKGAGKGELIIVDLKQLADVGDLRLNLWVKAGDIISVPPRDRAFVYVLGYVQRPGGFEVPGDKPMDVMQAVAMAGGLTGSARAENSFLMRKTSSGRRIIPVDLTKLARGTRPPLNMERGDTLVVGSGLWARLAEFLRPSIPLSPTQ